MAIGEQGYRDRAWSILETTRRIAEGVEGIPGLVLQGQVGVGMQFFLQVVVDGYGGSYVFWGYVIL